jgi:hypothetical protein
MELTVFIVPLYGNYVLANATIRQGDVNVKRKERRKKWLKRNHQEN